MTSSEDDTETNFNPRRRLCPDGGCIGIIGRDGLCAVCGTKDSGGPALTPSVAGSEEELDAADVEAELESDDEGAADTGESGFDPSRRLCSDDACVGVIGGDNRCKVCGKPA